MVYWLVCFVFGIVLSMDRLTCTGVWNVRKHSHLTEKEVFEKYCLSNSKRGRERMVWKAAACDICSQVFDEVTNANARGFSEFQAEAKADDELEAKITRRFKTERESLSPDNEILPEALEFVSDQLYEEQLDATVLQNKECYTEIFFLAVTFQKGQRELGMSYAEIMRQVYSESW